ncbi:Transposable element Tcb2 transposase [Eumeta japonica]|uniref:Transposable element Tcb2 transposase n=1 Tax=Eumeta variegata TaxID=151549 RepID=A0A4C1TB39_EUMVA|nr:Transposable element Tcb2 transposase [Eumeta japonica]
MGKGKEISEPNRKTVIKLRNEGNSLFEIGRILNLKKPTVQTIIKNFKESGNYESKPRAGRPRILDERTDRAITRLIKENPKQSAVEINRKIKDSLGVEVSDQTIRRSIKNNGYNSRVARRKPLLSAVNKQKRLEYAQKYENIHVTDATFWERVIFTDECKFMIFGGDGRARVWRKPNTALEPQNVNSTVKHGGGSVMVWGMYGRKWCWQIKDNRRHYG